jgi:hypothetical protein
LSGFYVFNTGTDLFCELRRARNHIVEREVPLHNWLVPQTQDVIEVRFAERLKDETFYIEYIDGLQSRMDQYMQTESELM